MKFNDNVITSLYRTLQTVRLIASGRYNIDELAHFYDDVNQIPW